MYGFSDKKARSKTYSDPKPVTTESLGNRRRPDKRKRRGRATSCGRHASTYQFKSGYEDRSLGTDQGRQRVCDGDIGPSSDVRVH